MTMKLTITRSDNAHYAARIVRKTRTSSGTTKEHVGTVEPGESLDVFMYATQSLVIREQPAKPKDPTP